MLTALMKSGLNGRFRLLTNPSIFSAGFAFLAIGFFAGRVGRGRRRRFRLTPWPVLVLLSGPLRS
ncbi:hypothetical protein, partial [Rhizobium pisi]|uniref:hypothetical protein n=1 Tax=Rhizobium pisi TaxID=574561 RepID=UPI001AED66A8